ncbi:MAG: polysaccharide biosynthesis/export family protein [Desulforegulaceae bacterium]|nr:polysaccharide biosynthesis/export family protein [Desulforegulaceae bacterium]
MFSKKKFKKSLFLFLFVFVWSSIGFGEETKTLGSKYLIGEGDVLKINVWKEPDLTIDAARVRLDGKITFPLLDDIKASGATTMELKETIQEKLGKFVEAPTVTVTLIDSASKKFYILGEIAKTGEYPILKSLTVMQAFALAGGFTEWASKKEILLFRYNEGVEEKIIINYRDILKGDMSKNIPIKTDDIIVVP